MVYCTGCGTIIAEGFYCVDCQPQQFATSAPSTDLTIPTANSNNIVYNNNWRAQMTHAFEMSASNAVSTLHIEFNGQVIDATFRSERKQCNSCLAWFPDGAGYNRHRISLPVWCTKHRSCFSHEEVHYHGMKREHDRCFVVDCPSKYRHEAGWTPRQIKEHVKKAHSYSGKALNWG